MTEMHQTASFWESWLEKSEFRGKDKPITTECVFVWLSKNRSPREMVKCSLSKKLNPELASEGVSCVQIALWEAPNVYNNEV